MRGRGIGFSVDASWFFRGNGVFRESCAARRLADSEDFAMATSTRVCVPLEEYLETTYRPDRDWIDGELKERNMGETKHAAIQGFLVRVCGNNGTLWKVRVLPEQRVQTSVRHYRIADVCLVRVETGYEPIIRTAPLLCVEILSRDDRMTDIQERVDDYTGMGVDTVWVIDPRRRKAYQASADGVMRQVSDELTVPGTAILIPIAEMFAELEWTDAGEGR